MGQKTRKYRLGHKLGTHPPAPITGVSDSWAAVISKALQKEPDNRYQAANDMLNDISMGKIPVVAQPQPAAPNVPNVNNTGDQTVMAPGPLSNAPHAPWEQSSPSYGAPVPPVQGPPAYNYGIRPGMGFDPNMINISVQHPANPWKRLVAWVVDMFLLNIFMTLIGLFFLSRILSGDQESVSGIDYKLRAIQLLVYSAYFIIMNGLYGQTVGKMAMSIRIVKADNSEFTFGNALVRYVLQTIFATFTLGLIYIYLLTNMENKGLHDQIAGTMVVDG